MSIAEFRSSKHTTDSPVELDACAGVPDPQQAARQAAYDARHVVHDVRQIDPRELWGRLCLIHPDRDRTVALIVALAAMVPDDRTQADLLAWTRRFEPRETAA